MIIFFFMDTAPTEIYTLSLHDALPISDHLHVQDLRITMGTTRPVGDENEPREPFFPNAKFVFQAREVDTFRSVDRKSTRLNSSHANISYAVFCLKKNNIISCFQVLATN